MKHRSLVDNAIDAMMDVGGRERQLEIACRLEHGDTLAISVRDSGRGIAEEDKDRVFDAFQTTKPGALGMGLAISRSIVEGHGGRARARSRGARRDVRDGVRSLTCRGGIGSNLPRFERRSVFRNAEGP